MMYSILLIDDEPMIKTGIRKLLKDTDYIIAGTASNGMEALSLLKITPVDIVLTDLKMPVMDGIELIRHLKAMNFNGVILALSNYSDFELVREALTQGASDYLLKADITRAHLLSRLDKMSEKLRDHMETAKKDDEFHINKRQLLLSEWQHYLTDTDDLSPEARSLLFHSVPAKKGEERPRPSVHLILVSTGDPAVPEQRRKRLVTQIKEILPDIFGVSGSILLLQTDATTLLCLLPCAVCIQDISSYVRLIRRRVSMYFNAAPVMSCAEGLPNPSRVKRGYQACLDAIRYRFYYEDTDFFPTEKYPPFRKGDNAVFSSFVRHLSDACAEKKPELITESIQKYADTCRENRFDPEWAVETCCHLVEQLFLSQGYPATELLSMMDGPRASRSVRALQESMTQLILYRFREHPEVSVSEKKEIQDVLVYIKSHLADRMTLDDMAEHVNLNKSYLCRIFKQQMEVSIFVYINQLRMEKGAQYIREHLADFNVKEAAAFVGIDDPFYFTRKFTAYWGKSPREYAKNAGQ